MISSLTSTYTITPDPVFFLDGKIASFQPEALQSAVLNFGSVVEELSSLLREFLFIRKEKKICLWPKNFLQTVESTLGRKEMPETLLKTLRSHFGEMYQKVTLPVSVKSNIRRTCTVLQYCKCVENYLERGRV